MEHVEVLRDLSEVCRAAIKAGDWKVDGACDPDSLLRHADAAITSLSAPQSGDWVLVRRSAIESAIETLENDGDEHGEGRSLRAAIDEAAAPQPPAEAQPPSAPVGVDEVVRKVCERLDKVADYAHTIDGETVVVSLSNLPAVLTGALSEVLAQQPAAEVYVDFPQVGTAGPLAVVDGRVTLPDTTMNDLIRHARTGYVEKPAAVDGALEIVRDIAEQKPEKPDYWSSCSQCESNIDRAQEVLAAQPGDSDNDR